MGTSLTGLTPSTTYDALIKVGDNGPITSTLKTLSDGLGNDLPMEASTTAINFTGTLTQSGTTLQPILVSGTNIKTINGTSLLGSGNIPVVTSPSGVAGAIQFSNGSAFASDAANLFWDDTNNRLKVSGTSEDTPSSTTGGILNIIGSATNSLIIGSVSVSPFPMYLQSGGSNIYPLALNPQGGQITINTTTSLGAQLGIKGSGSTSATTSLLVQNSGGSEAFRVYDDSLVVVGSVIQSNNFSVGQSNPNLKGITQSGLRIQLNYVNNGGVKFSNSSTGFGTLIVGEVSENMVSFGGITSSFPALKRSTTNLQVRLADDSGYAPIDASLYKVGGTSGFTGTGSYTNFTIVGGIITNAS